jgi:hypothetical protein
MEAVMDAPLDLFLYKEDVKPLMIYVRNGTQQLEHVQHVMMDTILAKVLVVFDLYKLHYSLTIF